MDDRITFVAVAAVVFVFTAGSGALLFEPDVVVTAPTSLVAFVISWPVAYWLVYRSDATSSPEWDRG